MNDIEILEKYKKVGFPSLNELSQLTSKVELNHFESINTDIQIHNKGKEIIKLDSINRALILIGEAEKKGFKFFGTTDGNDFEFTINTKLHIQCDKGHNLDNETFKNINRRANKMCCVGCQVEPGKKISLGKNITQEERFEQFKKFVEEGGFTVVNKNYLGHKKKHELLCPQGHTVYDSPLNIERRTEEHSLCCKTCINDKEIQAIKDLIESRDGVLIDTKYKNQDTKMTFKCAEEHEFKLSKKQVEHGRWCDCCETSKLKTENKIKMFVEVFFLEKFEKSRDDWNLNRTARKFLTPELVTKFIKGKRINSGKYLFSYKLQPMELDIVNKDLKIAFEYNGEHHYELNTRIKTNKVNDTVKQLNKLYKYKDNDFVKSKNCEEQGIKLFVIPAMKDSQTKSFEKALEHFIKYSKLQGLDISYTESQLDYMRDKFFQIKESENHIEQYKNTLNKNKVIKNKVRL